jgi:hypothetical protein
MQKDHLPPYVMNHGKEGWSLPPICDSYWQKIDPEKEDSFPYIFWLNPVSASLTLVRFCFELPLCALVGKCTIVNGEMVANDELDQKV